MNIVQLLYWGLAYTTGIAGATIFLFRYFQKGDRQALRLFLFLLPFGAAIASLSIMEGFSGEPLLRSIAGRIALIAATLTGVTFPYFALGSFTDGRRRRAMLAIRYSGLSLTALNVLAFFIRLPQLAGALIELASFLLLGLAIFTGMTWITRGSVRWESKFKLPLMGILFVSFALVLVVDIFRALIPPLSFLGRGYVILPGFYAYLNVFLARTHFRDWERDDSGGSEAASRLLERHGISEREREVLGLLAQGRTYREIADSLCISMATIKSHVSHLYEKTGTRNKVELINLLYDSWAPGPNQPNTR